MMPSGLMPDTMLAPAAPRIEPGAGRERVREVAEEFEAMVLGQMIEHMFAGIETDGPFGGGHGEKLFRSLLIGEYGKLLSRRGGIGIADAVERDLLGLQEVTR